MIPDIAAKSGIFASDIPILNGSKRANEHFSGTFWQRDSGKRMPRSARLSLSGSTMCAQRWNGASAWMAICTSARGSQPLRCLRFWRCPC